MKKQITINAQNIDELIRNVKEQIRESNKGNKTPKSFIIAKYYPKGISKRYKGKGRPRKSDYIKGNMLKLIGKYAKTYPHLPLTPLS